MQEPITSPQNEKLKLVRRLADRRGREKENLFATEGEDLLAAGLEAGWDPVELLVTPGCELGFEPRGSVVPAEVDPSLLASVAKLGSGTRVIAVWPLLWEVHYDPGPVGRLQVIYLHGVGDPGNVGTILRSAAALTDARVMLGPGCADPFSPKATRGSMGAVFMNPPLRGEVESTPRPRLALAAHGGTELDAALEAIAPRTICLGSERAGLDETVLGACDAAVTIPVLTGTESLNVAATAAIVLHRVSSLAGPQPPAE